VIEIPLIDELRKDEGTSIWDFVTFTFKPTSNNIRWILLSPVVPSLFVSEGLAQIKMSLTCVIN
jgi:hypothetical protein